MPKKLAVLVSAALLSALSAAQATTVSGSYYEEEAETTCTLTAACHMTFPVLPASTNGMFLNLEEISCQFIGTQVPIGGRIYISDSGANARRAHYFDINAIKGTEEITYFSEPLKHKLAGGPPRQLRIWFQFKAATEVHMKCALVGSLSST